MFGNRWSLRSFSIPNHLMILSQRHHQDTVSSHGIFHLLSSTWLCVHQTEIKYFDLNICLNVSEQKTWIGSFNSRGVSSCVLAGLALCAQPWGSGNVTAECRRSMTLLGYLQFSFGLASLHFRCWALCPNPAGNTHPQGPGALHTSPLRSGLLFCFLHLVRV